MVNLVWLILLVGGLAVSAAHHAVGSLTEAIVGASQQAVEVAFGFIGVMSLWLGMARIAEESGLMRGLARLMAPVIGRLFPGMPKDHPAMGHILMNLAANLLGMGGAATPFGLKAMEGLQALNAQKDQASADMITFLALNTASVNLIPAMVIALRAAAGSRTPADIVAPTVIATSVAWIAAVGADRVFRWLTAERRPRV